MISILHIDGMRTVHCVRAVFTALGGVAGVERAEVSMGRAVVTHEGPLALAAVTEALAPVGYAVRDLAREERRLPVLPGEDAAPGDGEGVA